MKHFFALRYTVGLSKSQQKTYRQGLIASSYIEDDCTVAYEVKYSFFFGSGVYTGLYKCGSGLCFFKGYVWPKSLCNKNLIYKQSPTI